MIRDVHTHINNYHEEKVKSLEDCLSLLTDTMAENKVDYSLALTSYKVNEHRPSTQKVVKAMEESFLILEYSYCQEPLSRDYLSRQPSFLL